MILMPLTFEIIIQNNHAMAESRSLHSYPSLSRQFNSDQPIVEKLQGLNYQLSILDKHMKNRFESK
tara:strand:- start:8260 stop:8457 length:198 start_codon:yes stop_codon:yes gene_type:complete